MKFPTGKGYLIWKLSQCALVNGVHSPALLAEKAVKAGLSWVSIKVQNWYSVYQPDLLGPAIRALRDKGISVRGWGYLVGADNNGVSIAAREADCTIRIMRDYLLDGFDLDVEGPYKRPGSHIWAGVYTTAIRRALPTTPFGLCSYRFPSLHRELPWSVFLAICNYHLPQVYWEYSHNPADQVQQSYNELQALKPLPFFPVGSVYKRGVPGGSGYWAPSLYDLAAFNGKVKLMGLSGIGWYSWASAESGGTIPPNPEWWDFIAGQEWGPPAPPPLTLEQRVRILEEELSLLDQRVKRLEDAVLSGS